MLPSAENGGLITVRRVSLNGDYSIATITYTVVGGQLGENEAQKQLEAAAPLCRLRLARRLNMRKTPRLVFRHDDEELAADKMRDLLESIDAEIAENAEDSEDAEDTDAKD